MMEGIALCPTALGEHLTFSTENHTLNARLSSQIPARLPRARFVLDPPSVLVELHLDPLPSLHLYLKYLVVANYTPKRETSPMF